MPPSSPIASPTLAALHPRDQAATLTALRDLLALTKPRLGFFSVVTTMAAYGLGPHGAPAGQAAVVLSGTTLAAAGALSLNQWWERDFDRMMRRTRARPLPRGAVSPGLALVWSLGLSLGGVAVLAFGVNIPAALFAAATIVTYGLVYTPLKRRTRWATEVGAVSGALPPLLGGVATGDLAATPAAWVLAAVLLAWQMPHFFAIGWMHREDYRAAGFRLLPAIDRGGSRTAAWSVIYVAALAPTCATAWFLGYAGAIFGVSSIAGSVAFLASAVTFLRATSGRDAAARQLFVASILYLPLVIGALVLDRVL